MCSCSPLASVLSPSFDSFIQGDHKPGKLGVPYSGISTNMKNSGNSVQPFNKQNSFSSMKYLRNTTRSWASNEQSVVTFRDGHSVLVTCYIAGVDVE